MESKLEAFLKEAIGKKYGVNARKLTRQRSNVKIIENDENDEKKESLV